LSPLRPCAVHAGIFLRWFVHGEFGVGGLARALGRFSVGLVEGYAKGWFVPAKRDLARHVDRRRDRFEAYGRALVQHGRDRLRVVLVSQQFPPQECGGIGVYTEQLAQALVDDGHHVVVVAEGPKRTSEWREGVHVVRVPSEAPPSVLPRGYRVTRRNVARAIAVDRAVRELVGRERVQLVESPLWDAETFVSSVRHLLPLVLRLNTPMAMAIETQDWRTNDDFELACEMEWRLLRSADGVIDPSSTILGTLAQRWDVRPETNLVANIPFGVRLPVLRERPLAGPNDPVRFLFMGRLERRKGIDTLLAAIPTVLQACPNASFDIAGAHPAGRATDITSTIPPALRDRVRVHGWVDDAERARLYEECDVFVAPSRYESFGIVYIEAMAYGKPCVACDEGGARAVVGHEEAGLLTPPEDAEALAGAMVRLIRDPDLRARLATRARARVQDRYTVAGMARSTVDFYEKVLTGTAPPIRADDERSALRVGDLSIPISLLR
jgi:glycosyltransferase involved in cell wall biosynthesis